MEQKTSYSEVDGTVAQIVAEASDLEGRTAKLNSFQEKIGLSLLREASKKVRELNLSRNHGIIVMNHVYSHFNMAYDNLRNKLRQEISEGVERVAPYLQRMFKSSESYLEEITREKQEIATTEIKNIDVHPKVMEVIDEKESDRYASPL